MTSSRWKCAPALALIAFIAATWCGQPRAQSWDGDEIVRDDVRHIHNPAEGLKPEATLQLQKLWRIGDESGGPEELFGLIGEIVADEAGNIYIVDYQISEVRVFSPEGTYLRTIGREGEGPGEYRRPSDICIGPDRLVSIVEAYPSQIKQFTMEGDPVGALRVRETPESDPTLINSIKGNDAGIVAHCLGGYPEETGGIQHFYLCAIDRHGVETHRFFSEVYRENPAKPVVREKRNYIRDRWSLLPDGRVIIASDFNQYKLEQWTIEGNLEQVITRDYEPRKRSAQEKQFMLDWIGSYREGMHPDTRFQVEEYDKDIMALYASGDGGWWVLSSRGFYDRPEGSLGTFDLFDRDGHFIRNVTMMGEGDPFTDRYYFLGNRLFVLRHYIDALVALRGGTEKQIAKEELEPMSIICYEIDFPE